MHKLIFFCQKTSADNDVELQTNVATRGVLTRSENNKVVIGQGSAPDPAGGSYNAPPDALVGWGGGNSLTFPTPSTPSRFLAPAAPLTRRLRRLALGVFGTSTTHTRQPPRL